MRIVSKLRIHQRLFLCERVSNVRTGHGSRSTSPYKFSTNLLPRTSTAAVDRVETPQSIQLRDALSQADLPNLRTLTDRFRTPGCASWRAEERCLSLATATKPSEFLFSLFEHLHWDGSIKAASGPIPQCRCVQKGCDFRCRRTNRLALAHSIFLTRDPNPTFNFREAHQVRMDMALRLLTQRLTTG